MAMTAKVGAANAQLDAQTLQIVSFRIGREEYGINIMLVQEIILMGRITRVPEAPEFILGVINLRGNVIPIVNLRARFHQEAVPVDEHTRIVVVNVGGRTIGIVVDAVSEVLRIAREQIAPPPQSLSTLGRDSILGLARLQDRLLILLDVERMLGGVETQTTLPTTGTTS